MRCSLSLIISIDLAILTVLPVAVSGSSSAYLYQPSNGQPQQYGLFAGQVSTKTFTQRQAEYRNDITQTRVNLNAREDQSQVNHGEVPVGLVGIKVSEDLGGAIIEEYPPSNLCKLGIVPGDRVVAVEGQPVNFITFEDQCRGAVDQLRHLTIIHNGQVLNVNVPLIDSRRLVQYNPDFQHSASMTVQW